MDTGTGLEFSEEHLGQDRLEKLCPSQNDCRCGEDWVRRCGAAERQFSLRLGLWPLNCYKFFRAYLLHLQDRTHQ